MPARNQPPQLLAAWSDQPAPADRDRPGRLQFTAYAPRATDHPPAPAGRRPLWAGITAASAAIRAKITRRKN